MKSFTTTLAPLILLGLLTGPARAKDPPLLSLNMAHFKDTATVTENSKNATTTISTENGFAEHKGPMLMVWNDEFLEAVIDDETGRRSFQVHAWVIYSGAWRDYEAASYPTANGPRSVPAAAIRRTSANCLVRECTYTEHVAFPVEEKFLRELAAGYVPDKPSLWRFRLLAKTGPAYSGELSNAEIAGLLAKVDEYTGAHAAGAQVAAAPAQNAGGAALKLGFGIDGLPVAATVEQPNRAGILVVAVSSGSVAQKSGIIVGDILYEVDGHPMRTAADLKNALAACAAHCTVAIKLFRGTDAMSVTARF